MRVLKFGGTSVSNAERFIRVADILGSNSRQGQVAAVLSAPAKITNTRLLDGLAAAQQEFDHPALRSQVEQEFTQLKQLLHGILLLKYCPDSVNAAIISRGEKLSIALMEALLSDCAPAVST